MKTETEVTLAYNDDGQCQRVGRNASSGEGYLLKSAANARLCVTRIN